MPTMNMKSMPHAATETAKQETNKTANSSEAGSVKVKKKKRPRIRIRPRNKCFKLAAQEQSAVKSNTELPTSQTIVNSVEEKFDNNNSSMKPTPPETTPVTVPEKVAGVKTREQIMAEREAKKLAKQAKKTKTTSAADSVNVETQNGADVKSQSVVSTKVEHNAVGSVIAAVATDNSREKIMAEREAKKLAKQAAKTAKLAGSTSTAVVEATTEQLTASKPMTTDTAVPTSTVGGDDKKKPTLSKAERRAIQEAQRAAKAQAHAVKQKPVNVKSTGNSPPIKPDAGGSANKSATITVEPQRSQKTSSPTKSSLKTNDCKVKLFNHLASARKDVSLFINNPLIHPSIARLGEQYAQRTVVGSNARCIAFLNALKAVIQDFVTPPKKAFSRSLETTISHCVEHLQKCRPLAVSVVNAHKHIKHVLTQLPSDQPELELKENLCHFIETYIENQIDKAAQAISSSMQEKISNGDVILTFGCSSLINYICEEAHRRHVDFRVIVVDSRPFCEGQELLRRLTIKAIPCTYVLINAVSFVMPEVTKVLLGAHALLSNGYVMGRVGTAQVALVAQSFNVPVLVCCETHKFSERFQTDAIVYNELGNPDDLVINDKCCLTNWQSKAKMSPLNLIYDITPSELVTAVVTEVSILPCTSVPVILRIKPTEIGYC